MTPVKGSCDPHCHQRGCSPQVENCCPTGCLQPHLPEAFPQLRLLLSDGSSMWHRTSQHASAPPLSFAFLRLLSFLSLKLAMIVFSLHSIAQLTTPFPPSSSFVLSLAHDCPRPSFFLCFCLFETESYCVALASLVLVEILPLLPEC